VLLRRRTPLRRRAALPRAFPATLPATPLPDKKIHRFPLARYALGLVSTCLWRDSSPSVFGIIPFLPFQGRYTTRQPASVKRPKHIPDAHKGMACSDIDRVKRKRCLKAGKTVRWPHAQRMLRRAKWDRCPPHARYQ
jgi:hypothetical protein